MWMSYGGRARSGALPEARGLAAVLAPIERLALPLAIAILFAYPSPLVPAALAVLAASAGVRAIQGRLLPGVAPADPWLLLLGVGTLLGLAVAHHPDAAMLRFTGVVGALALYSVLRHTLNTEADVRRAGLLILAALTGGVLAVLALLRGSLPESAVSQLLAPLTAPFAVFPGVSGDTLDVNARFTVHQYGLAHLALVGALFAVAAAALGRERRTRLAGLAALVLLVPLLLATQARGAFLALALAATAVASLRTRLAWAIPPLAGLTLYVLLQRGTISRGVELEWLDQRLRYWSGTLSLLGDLPLTGAGLGMRTFAEVFAWYHQLPDPYQVSHTHNVVIQAYAEQGLLGAVGLAGLLAVGAALGLRATRRCHGPSRWLVAGAAGGFLGSAIYGLTDQVPTNNLSLALVLALLALTVAADRIWAPSAARAAMVTVSPRRRPAARRGRLLVAGLVVVGLAGAVMLAPRWISGLYLNLGSARLIEAVLDPTRDTARRAERLQQAEVLLAAAADWNPSNVPALRNLGWARLLRYDLAGATTAIEAAYRPNATSFERAQLARLAHDAGLVTLTIRLYQEGGDEERLSQFAGRLWSARRWHDAALAYAALTELDPDEAEYISNFAKAVLEGGGDDAEALNALLTAVSRKPEAARSLSRQLVLEGEPYRSNEKRQGGNFPAARFWFALASRVDPSYDRPEVELGSIHFYRGYYEQAALHFHEAARRDPRNPSTMHQLGETYVKLGRLDEALGYYERGVALRPDRADLHLNLARAYLLAGRHDDAMRALWAGLERAPAGSDVQAAILAELKRVEAGG